MGFKIKIVTRNEEGHFLKIKESIPQYVVIINMYSPHNRAKKLNEWKTDRIEGGEQTIQQ